MKNNFLKEGSALAIAVRINEVKMNRGHEIEKIKTITLVLLSLSWFNEDPKNDNRNYNTDICKIESNLQWRETVNKYNG